MKNVRWMFPGMVALVILSSCDKATEWLESETSGEASIGQPGGEPDEGLAALVRRSADGVAFRRDQEFPKTTSGSFRVLKEYDNMVFMSSTSVAKDLSRLDGNFESVIDFKKTPGEFELTYMKLGELIPEGEQTEEVEGEPDGTALSEGAAVAEQEARPMTTKMSKLEGQTLRFAKTKEGWRYRRSGGSEDFGVIVQGESLAEQIPVMLKKTGVYPREVWFSAERYWKEGDSITLKGPSLKLLDSSATQGSVVLTFDKEEAIEGHPCGVFTVSGHMLTRSSHEEFEGREVTSNVSIESGRVWASLLYPIIMREEMTMVHTSRLPNSEGGSKGFTSRLQGGVSITRSVRWESGAEEE